MTFQLQLNLKIKKCTNEYLHDLYEFSFDYIDSLRHVDVRLSNRP